MARRPQWGSLNQNPYRERDEFEAASLIAVAVVGLLVSAFILFAPLDEIRPGVVKLVGAIGGLAAAYGGAIGVSIYTRL